MPPDVPSDAPGWLAVTESELPPGDGWLTAGEADRAAAMPFPKRRTEFLLRRWACKRAVAAATGLGEDPPSLARIEVGNRPDGSPTVSVGAAPAGPEVSLSDRAGWAVCVVGRAPGRLGCDLELVEPRSPGLVADFLTAAEQAYVAAQPAADRDLVTNLVWSAKESGLKVLRTGLGRDTRSVEVVVEGPDDTTDDGWSALEVHLAEGGVLPGWWRRAGAFVVTVVGEVPMPPPALLAGSADLDAAAPVHGWAARPGPR
jgi:4'-phosphopantetheinyl transferase